MSFVRIIDVHKRYNSLSVLRGIHLEISKEDFLVLVGPSGCGKSTLLNIIAGLTECSSGEIWIDGRSMQGVRPSDRDIAMVFQSYALYPNMTVFGNISFGMEMRKIPRYKRREAVLRVSKLLRIEPLLGRRPSELSGGQRQRVAMGRALVRDPRLFLFDEPLSNLDAKLRVEMRSEIKLLRERISGGIVYVTHDQVEAMTLASKIAVMREGEIHQFGTPEEIYNRPANLFVAGFMGSPSMNFLKAQLRESKTGLVASVEGAQGEQSLSFPLGKDMSALYARDKPEVVLGVRPEAILPPRSVSCGGSLFVVDLPVKVVEKTGSDTFVVFAVGNQEAMARFPANVNLRIGEKAAFAFDLRCMVVFDPETQQRVS